MTKKPKRPSAIFRSLWKEVGIPAEPIRSLAGAVVRWATDSDFARAALKRLEAAHEVIKKMHRRNTGPLLIDEVTEMLAEIDRTITGGKGKGKA